MNLVHIKPLSVNQAWKGRRFKTNDYKQYEKDLMKYLPFLNIPEGALKISFVWGFSSAASDWDNPIKPTQDILEKYYGFNDNRIAYGCARKVHVKKGSEFFEFKIEADTFPEFTYKEGCYYRDGLIMRPSEVLELMETN